MSVAKANTKCKCCEKDHWPHLHDINFESCDKYGTQDQCVIKDKDNQFKLKKPCDCCHHCSMLLLLPTKNLSIEPIFSKNKLFNEYTKCLMIYSIFSLQNINIFLHFLKRKAYLNQFIVAIDPCIKFCTKISSLNRLCYSVFMNHHTSEITKQDQMQFLKKSFFRILTVFFGCFRSNKHVVWLIKIKNGYYFHKYIMKPFYEFDSMYLEIRKSSKSKSGSRSISAHMLSFHGVMKYGLPNHLQIATMLKREKKTKRKKNKKRNESKFKDDYGVVQFLSETAKRRPHAGSNTYCVDCVLNNDLKSLVSSKFRLNRMKKCRNRRCGVDYHSHLFGIDVESKSTEEWEALFKQGKIEMKQEKKFYKCKQCKMSNYCSKKCQKIDWKAGHRHICKYFI